MDLADNGCDLLSIGSLTIFATTKTTQHNKGFVKRKVDKMIEEGLIKGAVIMDINGILIYRNP